VVFAVVLIAVMVPLLTLFTMAVRRKG